MGSIRSEPPHNAADSPLCPPHNVLLLCVAEDFGSHLAITVFSPMSTYRTRRLAPQTLGAHSPPVAHSPEAMATRGSANHAARDFPPAPPRGLRPLAGRLLRLGSSDDRRAPGSGAAVSRLVGRTRKSGTA